MIGTGGPGTVVGGVAGADGTVVVAEVGTVVVTFGGSTFGGGAGAQAESASPSDPMMNTSRRFTY